MASSTVFFCKECGYESAKWLGKCPSCNSWNSFVEEKVQKKADKKNVASRSFSSTFDNKADVKKLNEISISKTVRISTGFEELDRVLGSGLVVGSLTLIGGEPGIGKSTLIMQVCGNLAKSGKVLYVSGEESETQVKIRADRLNVSSDDIYFLSETNISQIEEKIASVEPKFCIIDSIQTMYDEDISSVPGSISQVKEVTARLMYLAKRQNLTVIVIGHVTKDGVIAGPRILEHMVDTVLYFEGDKNAAYRILRAVKNRFGSTNEIGVFEMRETGLAEVTNPSEYMLDGRPDGAPGSVVACLMEGTRPMLVEIQALVCQSNFGMPRRTAAGADINRFNLLMAVLEKRIGLRLSGCDAYLNIAGGLRISEPALDLAIVYAVLSSYKNIAVDHNTIVFGEVGLAGEIRAVSHAAVRVNEAVKLGFTTCILPEVCLKNLKADGNIKLVGIKSVNELLNII